jgi:chorismate mutase
MGLAEVREKINDIDGNLMTLLDERAKCSVGVADAKLDSGDLIYKPEREREICDKFAEAGKGMGANVIKTIMRNSRLIQYEMYVDRGIVPDKFIKIMENAGNGVFADLCMESCTETDRKVHTGLCKENFVNLAVKIRFENENANKLGKSDILSILAESGFEIKELQMNENTISAALIIGSDDAQRRKAYVLMLMLYMETVDFDLR